MKQAIIDIGSNSIRLTLYETKDQDFRILFKEKDIAGLASYVEDGKLTSEGIECACASLLTFQSTLKALEIDNVHVFATASLRNVSNSQQALTLIQAATGLDVEIITGQEEALLGYSGAMKELHLSSGAFMDIGGASTEVVTFDNGRPIDYASYPVGSLSLYHNCVKNILPGNGSVKKIKKSIDEAISFDEKSEPLLVAVGGTARAALKFAKNYFKLSKDTRCITVNQLDQLCEFFCSGKKQASELILKLEPERIHTLVPGLLILQQVLHKFNAQQLVISKYGVREGYLCQRILKNNIITPKTEN